MCDVGFNLISHMVRRFHYCFVSEISNSHDQMLGFQRMMQLLPVINRDTLYVLLQFLGLVAENSEDRKGDDGKERSRVQIPLLKGKNAVRKDIAG
jgi:hypothetical protein